LHFSVLPGSAEPQVMVTFLPKKISKSVHVCQSYSS